MPLPGRHVLSGPHRRFHGGASCLRHRIRGSVGIERGIKEEFIRMPKRARPWEETKQEAPKTPRRPPGRPPKSLVDFHAASCNEAPESGGPGAEGALRVKQQIG